MNTYSRILILAALIGANACASATEVSAGATHERVDGRDRTTVEASVREGGASIGGRVDSDGNRGAHAEYTRDGVSVRAETNTSAGGQRSDKVSTSISKSF